MINSPHTTQFLGILDSRIDHFFSMVWGGKLSSHHLSFLKKQVNLFCFGNKSLFKLNDIDFDNRPVPHYLESIYGMFSISIYGGDAIVGNSCL